MAKIHIKSEKLTAFGGTLPIIPNRSFGRVGVF